MENFDIINFLKKGGLNKSAELLKEDRAPGFAERKQGEPLPTLEGIKAAYEAKNGGEADEEDLFGDAGFEDLEQVIRNIAHTSGMATQEAGEVAIKHIEDTFIEAEDEDDLYEAEKGIKEDEDYDTEGYVEAMHPDLDKHIGEVIRIFKEWKAGPLTEPGMEGYAKDDLINYIQRKIRNA